MLNSGRNENLSDKGEFPFSSRECEGASDKLTTKSYAEQKVVTCFNVFP